MRQEWKTREKRLVQRLLIEGYAVSKIAMVLKRSRHSVNAYMRSRGLSRPAHLRYKHHAGD